MAATADTAVGKTDARASARRENGELKPENLPEFLHRSLMKF